MKNPQVILTAFLLIVSSTFGQTKVTIDEKLSNITKRPDGVKQIYLQDPDGYWIEVNSAKY
tara:strand:+ start:3320 stop:3502 length:183 start_codon:yes stop_codon:yes gene_type:complete